MTAAPLRPTLRRPLIIALMALGLAGAMFTGFSASKAIDDAEAYSSSAFCAPGGSWGPISAGGRCVSPIRVRHRYVEAHIYFRYGAGDFCAGAKANSDGTGANTQAFGCAYTNQTDYTYSGPFSSPGTPLGYATIINTTGATDYFWGSLQWYP